MPFTIEKVHVYKRQEETGRMILVESNPYTRFVQGGDPPVCIQRGSFYSDGGDRIQLPDVPQWVWYAVGKMTEDARKNIGLGNYDKLRKTYFNPKEGDIQPSKPIQEPSVILRGIIDKLDHADDTHWTKGGLPDLKIMEERFGKYVHRSDAEGVAPGYRRKEN